MSAIVAEDPGFSLQHLNHGGFSRLGMADEEEALTIQDDAAGVEHTGGVVCHNPSQKNLVGGKRVKVRELPLRKTSSLILYILARL